MNPANRKLTKGKTLFIRIISFFKKLQFIRNILDLIIVFTSSIDMKCEEDNAKTVKQL